MTQIEGLYWPDDVADRWQHALMHVKSAEWAIARCRHRRTAVQAGGNVGLWPRRIAQSFQRVITFEPDARSRECLERNVPPTVEVRAEALGDYSGVCGLKHRGLGSHRVVDGDAVVMTTVDAQRLDDVDYLQLDVEGYEWHALMGATETIRRCKPLVQLELRGFVDKYGHTDDEVTAHLAGLGYRVVSRQQGSDVVFAPRAAA